MSFFCQEQCFSHNKQKKLDLQFACNLRFIYNDWIISSTLTNATDVFLCKLYLNVSLKEKTRELTKTKFLVGFFISLALATHAHLDSVNSVNSDVRIGEELYQSIFRLYTYGPLFFFFAVFFSNLCGVGWKVKKGRSRDWSFKLVTSERDWGTEK